MADLIADLISYPDSGATRAAYLARPTGTGPFPGVIVIHEIFGLNDNIKEIADRLAAAGYAALAVDLFAGRNRTVCMFRYLGGLLRGGLKSGALTELTAALTFLAAHEQVDAQRVGAIGFCLGGSLAIAWACTDDRLKAIAPYYGVNPRPLAAVARSCPVVGSYPARDFTARAGRKLDAELRRHNIDHDITIYPDARHSFFNDRGSHYHAAAAQDSWQRVLTFFGTALASTPHPDA